jgi:hypothetical protein
VTFNILDNDPDDSTRPDHATWGVQAVVSYAPLTGGPPQRQFSNPSLVGIQDDPVPEPSAWSLMILGSGVLAGALRHRRSAHAAGLYP